MGNENSRHREEIPGGQLLRLSKPGIQQLEQGRGEVTEALQGSWGRARPLLTLESNPSTQLSTLESNPSTQRGKTGGQRPQGGGSPPQVLLTVRTRPKASGAQAALGLLSSSLAEGLCYSAGPHDAPRPPSPPHCTPDSRENLGGTAAG